MQHTHYLMLCELHHPEIHGKNGSSDPNIETHYLVFDRFDPITGISYSQFDEYDDNSDREYNSDSDDDYDDNKLVTIYDEIEFLMEKNYALQSNVHNHPTIRNYHNIVLKSNYLKPEIGEYIILPTQEAVAILKTFWLRIIQKKWKKVFQERKNMIKQKCNYINLPGLRGMLHNIK